MCLKRLPRRWTRAAQLGMSRSEYIRRLLAREAAAGREVSPADLAWFAGLADPGFTAWAWQ